MGDAAGVGDGMRAISATAVINSRGASKASRGPKIGRGRKAVGVLGKYLLIVCWSSSCALWNLRSFLSLARVRVDRVVGSDGSSSVSKVVVMSDVSGIVCWSGGSSLAEKRFRRRFRVVSWDGSRILLKCVVSRICFSRMVGGTGDGGDRIPTVLTAWGDSVARIWLSRMVGWPGGGVDRSPRARVKWESGWDAPSGGEALQSAWRQEDS
jgi:hypothetical protein